MKSRRLFLLNDLLICAAPAWVSVGVYGVSDARVVYLWPDWSNICPPLIQMWFFLCFIFSLSAQNGPRWPVDAAVDSEHCRRGCDGRKTGQVPRLPGLVVRARRWIARCVRREWSGEEQWANSHRYGIVFVDFVLVNIMISTSRTQLN